MDAYSDYRLVQSLVDLAQRKKEEKNKQDLSKIPGQPWVDYPLFHEIPQTSFSCAHVPALPGMYANVETGCQVICVELSFTIFRKIEYMQYILHFCLFVCFRCITCVMMVVKVDKVHLFYAPMGQFSIRKSLLAIGGTMSIVVMRRGFISDILLLFLKEFQI